MFMFRLNADVSSNSTNTQERDRLHQSEHIAAISSANALTMPSSLGITLCNLHSNESVARAKSCGLSGQPWRAPLRKRIEGKTSHVVSTNCLDINTGLHEELLQEPTPNDKARPMKKSWQRKGTKGTVIKFNDVLKQVPVFQKTTLRVANVPQSVRIRLEASTCGQWSSITRPVCTTPLPISAPGFSGKPMRKTWLKPGGASLERSSKARKQWTKIGRARSLRLA